MNDNRDIEEIRKSFKPEKVRFLFVGESPPKGETFFYKEDSLTTYTREAFKQVDKKTPDTNSEFLDYFMRCGCYLDDLSHEPLNHLSLKNPEERKQREGKWAESVGSLAERIQVIKPTVVIIIVKMIEKYVLQAVELSKCNLTVSPSLPYPSSQYPKHVEKYKENLINILREYSPVKLSIVMPVYNERETLRRIIEQVLATPFEKELVIVDDGSTDGSREVLSEFEGHTDVRIILKDRNEGKGAALRDGFAAVTGDIVIIQDADLEYDPAEYGRLIQPILDDKADVVYGSRFMGGPRRVLYYWHSVGNRLLTTLSNMLTNLNLTDMETCYKVFRREVLDRITIKSKRFGVEPELTAKVAKLDARVYEIPISYSGRKYSEGKKIGWRDGLGAFMHIIRYRFFD